MVSPKAPTATKMVINDSDIETLPLSSGGDTATGHRHGRAHPAPTPRHPTRRTRPYGRLFARLPFARTIASPGPAPRPSGRQRRHHRDKRRRHRGRPPARRRAASTPRRPRSTRPVMPGARCDSSAACRTPWGRPIARSAASVSRDKAACRLTWCHRPSRVSTYRWAMPPTAGSGAKVTAPTSEAAGSSKRARAARPPAPHRDAPRAVHGHLRAPEEQPHHPGPREEQAPRPSRGESRRSSRAPTARAARRSPTAAGARGRGPPPADTPRRDRGTAPRHPCSTTCGLLHATRRLAPPR
jgi:hypothetical protein